jgi:CDP-glycerol glycerophosphotransferase (TagB/SpsB family)
MKGGLRTAIGCRLRGLDHALGRALGRARVLVDVRTPMNLAVLEPIWGPLAADDRVQVLFASGEGAPLSPWTRIDVAMTADLWSQTPLRRCRRRINFFHGVAGKYDLDRPGKLSGAGLHRFDRLAFINRERMVRYLESGLIRPGQAVLVGYPKGDRLVNGTWDAAAVRASLGLPADNPTVLYAPTFSTANSLHLAGEAIVSTLLDSGRSVIVKLHDRSMVPHPKYTGGIDWPARLSRFDRHPRFALARGADAGPVLAAADLLVTDHSTVGFEFALLDRPVVVFDAPRLRDAARIDDDKWAMLRSMADIAATPGDLAAAVERALAEPGRHHDARRQAHDLFAYAGSATGRALEVVYEMLELEPRPHFSFARREVVSGFRRTPVSRR